VLPEFLDRDIMARMTVEFGHTFAHIDIKPLGTRK